MSADEAGVLLVLDFDGVLFDALGECALVTWYGEQPLPVGGTVAELLSEVPAPFLADFANIRRYARTLDHFLVALSSEVRLISDEAAFGAAFASLEPSRVVSFVERATVVRTELRRRDRAGWLQAHRAFPEVAALTVAHEGPVAVVTAKDAPSVTELLEAHSLAAHVDEVIGECHDKAVAVAAMAGARSIPLRSVTFIDDHLDNVLAVGQTGASARWAWWGYHTREHDERAARLGVRPITLRDVQAWARRPLPLSP